MINIPDIPARIPPRANNREKFCASLDFVSCQWLPNGNLERNYDAWKKNHPIFKDELELEIFEFSWQLHLQKSTNEETILAKQHIQTYLQYPYLKACKNRWHKFHFLNDLLKTWNFYRQLADEIIDDIIFMERIVQKYRQSTKFSGSLDTYLTFQIAGELRSRFYRKTGYGRYTLWYQLKIISQKELEQKLSVFLGLGISQKEQQQINKYIRARDYFYHIYNQVHIPKTPWDRPPSPLDKANTNRSNNNQIYDQVFERAFEYAQKQESNQANPIASLTEFIRLIDNCIAALKPPHHFTLRTSASEPHNQKKSPHKDLLESLKLVIKEEFLKLTETHQLALALALVFNLSQDHIRQILEREYQIKRDRSFISRWLNRFRQQLLTAIAKYLQEKFSTQLQCQLTPEMLAPIEQALKEDFKPQTGIYMKQYGKELIKRKIVISYHSISPNSPALSLVLYGKKWLNDFLPTPPTPRQNKGMQTFIEEFEEIDCDSS